MKITKDDKEYSFSEQKQYWLVSLLRGGLTVNYRVPKGLCNTEAELREHILKSSLF